MVALKLGETIIDSLSIITLYETFISVLYTNDNNMLLTVTSTVRIRFIGVTLNYPYNKYWKALIYTPFNKYKHEYFGYVHESKNQGFGNCNKSILCKFKHIVSHEGLHIKFHPNAMGSWFNVMVGWGAGETITEYLTIIIGGDTNTCALYVYDVQKKGQSQKLVRFYYF